MNNLLITLEGIDGSGKTTIARILANRLVSIFPEKKFVFTCEPTTSKIGMILRSGHLAEGYFHPDEDILKARKMEELFLFVADHANHLAKTVNPALKSGSIVISDRYIDSTATYQGATLKDIIPDPVSWIWDLYRPWNIVPDLTIFFSIDPSIAIERLRVRRGGQLGLERFEREEFLREVDKNLRFLAEREPERFAIIDASQYADDVVQDVLQVISKKISPKR